MSKITKIGSSTQEEISRLLDEVRDTHPEEVMIVFMKAGDVLTRSTRTFSRMRTVGALEILKHDIMVSE